MPRDQYNTNDYIPPEYIRIYAERSFPSQSVNLYVIREDGKVGRLEFENRAQFDFCPPTLQLPERGSEAQALMDRLWACGLRPTEGRGSAGALAATERHLADLRSLVEKSYKVQFKKGV